MTDPEDPVGGEDEFTPGGGGGFSAYPASSPSPLALPAGESSLALEAPPSRLGLEAPEGLEAPKIELEGRSGQGPAEAGIPELGTVIQTTSTTHSAVGETLGWPSGSLGRPQERGISKEEREMELEGD